jgi:membrane fusion protein (multidrug efflux system)
MPFLPRRHRAALLVAAAVAALAAIGFARAWVRRPPAGPGAGGAPLPVVVAEARLEELVDRIEAIGTARSNESVVITAKVTESVRRIDFEEGAEVEEGHILVELTGAEEAAQLAEARSQLEEAARNHQRVATLHAQGSAPTSQLESASSARDAARARVEAIEARLADRLVRAPFRGVLGLRAVSPGTLVRPGDRITTLDDVSSIKLDFAVPETFLAALAPGLEISARSPAYPGRRFHGVVETIDTQVDPVTRAVTVRGVLPNDERLLRPGMLLTVDLIRERRQALVVPEAALVPERDLQTVFAVDAEGVVARRTVEIGRRSAGRVEVRAGLAPGERVVVEGVSRVRDGSRVEVRSAP